MSYQLVRITTGLEHVELQVKGRASEIATAATAFAREQCGRVTSIRPMTDRDEGLYDSYECVLGKPVRL